MKQTLLALLLLVGCATTTAAKPPVNEVRRAFHNTVALESAGGRVFCSGVIVEHMVLTAWHCVDAGWPIWIRMATGERFEVAVGPQDSVADLALLVPINFDPGRGVRVARRAPTWGDKIWVIGHPLGDYEFSITQGIVSHPRRTDGIFGGVWMQHDAGTLGGNSGGPVLNSRGRLVGITSFGVIEPVINGFGQYQDTHIAGAVHLSEIEDLLRQEH